jgi:hypothetical protein
MKSIYKKWITALFLNIIVFYIVLSLSINYVIDIEHFFHLKETYQGKISGNIRFGKIEYLEKNYKQYNSFIIGGSRAGIIEGKVPEKYLPNTKFYNLSITSNTIDESYRTINYIADKYIVKNIILQISTNDLLQSDKKVDRLHYKISGENKTLFYLKHLFSPDISKLVTFYEIRKNPGAYIYRPCHSDGSWDYTLIEASLKSKKVQSKKRFNTSEAKRIKNIDFSPYLNSLPLIKKKCLQKDINLLIFFVPENHNYLDQFDRKLFLDFLKKVSTIVEFWNFSGYNSITLNDTNYYDYFHFRYFISDLIVKRIFNDTTSVPSDFGVYVTEKNIDSHISLLNSYFNHWDGISTQEQSKQEYP